MGTDSRYYKFCALVSELLAQVEDDWRVLRLAGQTWRTLSNGPLWVISGH